MLDYEKLLYNQTWEGNDVGFDNIETVLHYTLKDFPLINLYIDSDSQKIIEVWLDNETE